jgi:hypothetical protein
MRTMERQLQRQMLWQHLQMRVEVSWANAIESRQSKAMVTVILRVGVHRSQTSSEKKKIPGKILEFSFSRRSNSRFSRFEI